MKRREQRLKSEVERSPFAWELREFVRIRGRYEGPATWILINLNERATETKKAAKDWPKTANQVGIMLNKFAEGLKLKGVAVSFKRHGKYGRMWLLQQRDR